MRVKDHRKDSGRLKVFGCRNGLKEEKDKKALDHRKVSECLRESRILKVLNPLRVFARQKDSGRQRVLNRPRDKCLRKA